MKDIRISLKTYIITILIIILLCILLINFTSNNNAKLNNTITNIAYKDSKFEINHDINKIYKENENVVEKLQLTNNDEKEKIYTKYTKQFVDISENNEPIYSKDSSLFGWEENLYEGCSTWCSVAEYNVNVTATSNLKPHGRFSYSASNVQDINRNTAWVEGVDGSGIGECIELEQSCLVNSLDYKTDITFKELCIINGYAATEKNWIENNRVKELKMYFGDKYITNIVLEDLIEQQYIDISEFNLKVQNGETAKFKFEIVDIYKGTKYDDTCITGLLIEFSGRSAH